MSFGLISFSLDCETTPDVAVAPEELSIGTPSNIISGCSEEVIVTGNTVLAFLNKETKKPVKCPDYMLEKVTPLFK